MRTLSRRDVWSALATGLTTGIIAWRILVYLGKALPLGIAPGILVWLVPLCWLAGVQLGYALAPLFRPMAQFGKFAAIGFANAAVDFGVLYLFIGLTGHTSGLSYTLFKTVSFSVATVHSYLWNKYWAFDAGRQAASGREIGSFVGVSLVSLAINVGIASTVNALQPASVSAVAWAGVAAIIGSAAALVFSFAGFRMFVFKKK